MTIALALQNNKPICFLGD